MQRVVIPVILAVALFPSITQAQKAYVTALDLMTDTDAFYLRYLNPDKALSSVEDWPIVGHLVDLGSNVVDANIIATQINRGLPVDKQPAFGHVKQMVQECADRLGIKAPHLLIENSPNDNAYVTRLRQPHLLIITSSLYELYKDRPKELKFIIGHELGHLKLIT